MDLWTSWKSYGFEVDVNVEQFWFDGQSQVRHMFWVNFFGVEQEIFLGLKVKSDNEGC